MLSFRQYLRASKTLFVTATKAKAAAAGSEEKVLFDIVIGNEAGDCDSIVSSLLQAYYLSSTSYKFVRMEEMRHVFPVLPIPEADFKLRGETCALLKKCGILPDELIFLDQVPWKNVDIGRVTLVDHNALAPSMSFLAPAVHAIVDHHVDEKLYLDIVPDERRHIEMVGSCCSLIAEKFLKHEELFFFHDKEDEDERADGLESRHILSTLLFATIVLDTVDLSPDAKKATSLDIQMVDFFVKKFNYDRKKTFDSLQSIKFDPSFWKSLGIRDKLRLDYKQYQAKEEGPNKTAVGISAVLVPLSAWVHVTNPNTGKLDPEFPLEGQDVQDVVIDRSSFLPTVCRYMDEREIDVLIVMCLHFAEENGVNKPVRELLLASRDETLFTKFQKGLLETESSKGRLDLAVINEGLGLTDGDLERHDWGGKWTENEYTGEKDFSDGMHLYVKPYRQNNASASRKQVAPIVQQIL
jgi:inorganic pyrophosphatase/exopolyphosphatase